MLLSIIIINFNTTDLVLDCLRTFYAFPALAKLQHEIILVDNAPKADYRAILEQASEHLTYIRSEENIGFGRANNLGMEQARGKYFLLLNSDTLFIDDSLLLSIDHLEQDTQEQTGLLGCRLLNEDRSYQHSFYPFYRNSLWNYFKANNPLLHRIFRTNRYFTESRQTITVGDVSGAFMLLRRSVFKSVKGFDPDFFLYCEETEWCRNRIARHHKIVYFPATAIIHLGGKSAPREPMLIQSAVSEYLFWYKCGPMHYSGFILGNTLNALFFMLQYPFTGKENKAGIRAFLKRYRIALRYALYDIPKFGRGFHARPEPLIYDGAREIFFGKAAAKN